MKKKINKKYETIKISTSICRDVDGTYFRSLALFTIGAPRVRGSSQQIGRMPLTVRTELLMHNIFSRRATLPFSAKF